MVTETQATPSEPTGVALRLPNRPRALLVIAALVGMFLSYVFVQVALSSSTVFGVALSGLIALSFLALSVLNVFVGLSGFLPSFLCRRLTARSRADAP